jgi:hypothetical protein
MQLNVLHQSVVSPPWRTITDASKLAFQHHFDVLFKKKSIPFERIHRQILTPPSANAKLSKGSVPIYGLTLAPAGSSGYQLCPWRSPECEAACLGITAGRSRFSNVLQARINKTRLLMTRPYEFMRQLYVELDKVAMSHIGTRWLFRSNVLSDIPWEDIAEDMYIAATGADFYDYTKSFHRAMKSLREPSMPHLVLSHSGWNMDQCRCYMDHGGTAAFVFNIRKGQPLPASYCGYAVIDGDLTDDRCSDPEGVIVGLRAKGNVVADGKFITNV